MRRLPSSLMRLSLLELNAIAPRRPCSAGIAIANFDSELKRRRRIRLYCRESFDCQQWSIMNYSDLVKFYPTVVPPHRGAFRHGMALARRLSRRHQEYSGQDGRPDRHVGRQPQAPEMESRRDRGSEICGTPHSQKVRVDMTRAFFIFACIFPWNPSS